MSQVPETTPDMHESLVKFATDITESSTNGNKILFSVSIVSFVEEEDEANGQIKARTHILLLGPPVIAAQELGKLLANIEQGKPDFTEMVTEFYNKAKEELANTPKEQS